MEETLEDTRDFAAGEAGAVPGVVFFFSGETPCHRVARLSNGMRVLGRDVDGWELPDARVSREHLRLSYDGTEWSVRDLGSKNGVFVDGVRRESFVGVPSLVRLGHTLCLPRGDVRPYEQEGLWCAETTVVGARLARAHRAVRDASNCDDVLLIQGETGSGKDVAARHFHHSGPHAAGPFVAVNCATIPDALAESLLFGARRGAYSGAVSDTEGYLQAAEGGVLFLDEIAELELGLQAKLLRAIETRQVQPLGAARPIPLEIRVCAATHQDLRAEVARGRFRADLYYRLAQRTVRLPALSERLEELPWLIAQEMRMNAPALRVHARFVEACALRAWPGNVRELRSELRKALANAASSGADALRPQHLDVGAGAALDRDPERSAEPVRAPEPRSAGEPLAQARDDAERRALLDALERASGNRTLAARALGISRSTLYNKLREHGLD